MKAIGYIRVSTLDQSQEGVSLEHQEAKIRAYASLHNIDLVDVLIENDGENGKKVSASAKTIKTRPKVQAAIQMVIDKKVDCLIVYKLDRMFRNAAEALTESQKIDKAGGSLCSVTESIDTKSALGKFFFSIMASIAEMERNLIGERVRDALRHMKSTGAVTNHSPFGMDAVEGKLVENEKEQAVIRRIRHLAENGDYSLGVIAKWLNEDNVPAKNGGRWYSQTIKNVLKGS